MERIRESKRASIASSTARNGFHRRRHRTIAVRDSSEEGVSKRGRSKRRRSSHSRRDEGDEHSTEESVGNEQDDDVVLQDGGASTTSRSANTTTMTSFAAAGSDQILRRSFAPPPMKITDEMIGVAVPRKARSASVKRSHENCVSSSGGGDRNFRQRSDSPVEPASPSSSSVSEKKKMKAIGDASNKLKSSSSEIEIEIAELLYGLMTSKNHDTSSKDIIEKKKVGECDSSCALVPCNSTTAELVRIQSEQPVAEGVNYHCGNAAVHENGSSEVPKEDIGEEKKNSGDGLGVAANRRSVSPARESLAARAELNAEKQDSASNKVIPEVPGGSSQRIGKFEIDLMAPPPMMLSLEGDELSKGDFTSETKSLALDLEMKRDGSSIKVEDKEERPVKKGKTVDEKCDVIKQDLEKPKNRLEEKDRNKEQPKSSNSAGEKTAQSSSVPLSTAVSGCLSSSLPPTGYMPPLQTVVKTDKTTGSSTTSEHGKSVFSQPQLKRCATHHYIARNIFLHQQFTKMNPLLPQTVGSVSLSGTKSNNVNCAPSAESMAVGKQSQKQLPGVAQNATKEKVSAATSDHSLTTIKSSNNANPMDSTQRMQLVLQQGPHPGSTGYLAHGPAFMFPLGQHQTSVVTATSQAGGMNNTSSASFKSHSSASRSLATTSTLPAVGASMSFSYPNFSTNNDTPYVTIVQNNGYSFPFSSSIGANAAIRGASPAQATHILNGPPYYSSQTIHSLQHPQQHPHSQVLAQPSYLTASTSTSSSSHKQSHGVQVNDNSILTSPTMQSQQPQKQQNSLSRPLKHDTDIGGDNASTVANRKSFPQKNVHGQNFTTAVPPVNFSFRPPAISDAVGGNSGNFGDKQQQALKGGVETIPSQAFAISFASYNGTNIPSNLNFSSMAQGPVIFQSLPDIGWQGFQAASTPHTIQQRTYSITEGKSAGHSSHRDDEKKTTHGKPSTNNGPTTLVFDNSSKNFNFVLSPTNGNWPSCSIASTAVTSVASTAVTSVPLSSNASSSQESSQLLHLQKQHGMQQQQPAAATRFKASSTNITSATKFANNVPVFTQTQSRGSNQGSNSRSSERNIDSHVHHASILTSNPPNLKSFSQEQGRVSQGRMQISFGGDYMTSMPPQGQQVLTNKRSVCTEVAGTPLGGGSMKPNPEGRKVSSGTNTMQSQPPENSSAGSGKKSSPVCGRNVQPILSSCPSQLSELKY